MELVREISQLKVRSLRKLKRVGEDLGLWGMVLFSFGLAGLTGLAAQIRIPLPFSPVPVTGQVFVVLLVGFTFGKKIGLGSQIFYAGLGGLGLPWFTGMAGGFATLAGPTGGYILGFIPAVYLIGWLSQGREVKEWLSTLGIGLLGLSVIYLFGTVQLSLFLQTGLLETIKAGLIPFIWIDLLKVTLVSLLVGKFD